MLRINQSIKERTIRIFTSSVNQGVQYQNFQAFRSKRFVERKYRNIVVILSELSPTAPYSWLSLLFVANQALLFHHLFIGYSLFSFSLFLQSSRSFVVNNALFILPCILSSYFTHPLSFTPFPLSMHSCFNFNFFLFFFFYFFFFLKKKKFHNINQ